MRLHVTKNNHVLDLSSVIAPFNSLNKEFTCTVIVPKLQMRKLRHREKQLTQITQLSGSRAEVPVWAV